MHSIYGGRERECKLPVEGRIFMRESKQWDFSVAEGCEVTVAALHDLGKEAKPSGPGLLSTDVLGWTMMHHTPRFGFWLFRGALRGEQGFACSCIWFGLGSSRHLPHSMGSSTAMPLPTHVWEAAQQWDLKPEGAPGCCSQVCGGKLHPDGSMVCCRRSANERDPELLRRFGVVCMVAQRR